MRALTQSRTGFVLIALLTIGIYLQQGKGHLRDQVRQFNKHYLNPFMLKHLRSRLAYYVVVQHVGRRSGKLYNTPVVAEHTSDGFIIPLTYGRQVDWLKNVQAAGSATIEEHGIKYRIIKPEILDRQAAQRLLRRNRWLIYRLLRVEFFLRSKRVKLAIKNSASNLLPETPELLDG